MNLRIYLVDIIVYTIFIIGLSILGVVKGLRATPSLQVVRFSGLSLSSPTLSLSPSPYLPIADPAFIDFDVFIVLSKVDQEADRWIRDIAWRVGFENDRVITTVLIDKEQFENGPMSESSLVANILREGLSI